jgi:hypothetical protein
MIAEIRVAMETLHLIRVESFRQDQKFRDQRTLGAGDRVRAGVGVLPENCSLMVMLMIFVTPLASECSKKAQIGRSE